MNSLSFHIPPQANPLNFLKQLYNDHRVTVSGRTGVRVRLLDVYDQELGRGGLTLALVQPETENSQNPASLIRTETWSEIGTDLSIKKIHNAYYLEHPEKEGTLKKTIGARPLQTLWSGSVRTRGFRLEQKVPPSQPGQASLPAPGENQNPETSLLKGRILELSTMRILIFDETTLQADLKSLTAKLRRAGYSPLSRTWLVDLMRQLGKKVFFPALPSKLLPARTVPLRKAVSDLATGFLAAARFYEAGILKDLDVECLHQYRVYVRRLRSLVSLCRTAFDPKDYSRVSALLKAIQEKTGPLRDFDVQLQAFPGLTEMIPVPQRNHLDSLETRLSGERRKSGTELKKWMAGKDYAALLSELERFFETWYKAPPSAESARSVGEVADEVLTVSFSRLHRRSRKLSADSRDHRFHRVRINLKQLRYLIEIFGPLYPSKPMGLLVSKLREFQTYLGTFQDNSVLIEYLTKVGLDPIAPDSSLARVFTTGMLVGVLHEKQRRARLSAIRRIRKFRKFELSGLGRLIGNSKTGGQP